MKTVDHNITDSACADDGDKKESLSEKEVRFTFENVTNSVGTIEPFTSGEEETEEAIPPCRVSVFDVAAYILHFLGKMSTMKLQKLVYYCQAWSLVWDENPLFPESIKAWANGPVVGELFYQLKGHFIVQESDLSIGNYRKLSLRQKETVDAVLKYYGDKSAQWLIELSHMEEPWRNARKGLNEDERSNRVIEHDVIAEYYSGLLNE